MTTELEEVTDLAWALVADSNGGTVRVDVTSPISDPSQIETTKGALHFISRMGAYYNHHYGNTKTYAYGYVQRTV